MLMLLVVILLLVLLILLQLLLLLLLLTMTLRGVLHLLAYAIPAEVGLDLRRRRVGLHRVGVLLRGLRHERSFEPVTQSSVSRSLKFVRSEFSKLFHEDPLRRNSAFSWIAYKDRFRRDSRTFGLFTKIDPRSENNFKLFLIICKDRSRENRPIREFSWRFIRILSGETE